MYATGSRATGPSAAASPRRAGGSDRRDAARAPALTIPSHMAGATAGSASRFAGSPATGTASKWCASSGAVARVAARVIAVPSARPRTSAARRVPAEG